MVEKQTTKDRLKEITDSIESGIKELFQSDKYRQYLNTMSHFHRYSVNNTILIHMQKPDASYVASFNKWKDQLHRHVKKGETGITIIAPMQVTRTIEEAKINPATKAPILDASGNAVTEQREIKIAAFRPVKVFDVSQTEGEPLPQIVSELHGSVENYQVFLEALKRTSSVPILMDTLPINTDGYFNSAKQEIRIRDNMSEIQTVCAMIHEITHSKLHDYSKQRADISDNTSHTAVTEKKSRNTEEVEAESVAYAVCAYYGIETGDNSFGYIASWSKDKDLAELKASLETINHTASEMITSIDGHYAELMKEKEAELNSKAENLFSVDDTAYIHIQSTDSGYDYTLYDKVSLRALDGGQMKLQGEMSEAVREICALQGISFEHCEPVPIEKLKLITAVNSISDIRRTYMEKLSGDQAPDLESQFMNRSEDAILLYQLKDEAPAQLHYTAYDRLEAAPSLENYHPTYIKPIRDIGSDDAILEEAFNFFNLHKPADFHGNSMSVSDIVAIKRHNEVSFHYCDSFGFKKLEELTRENPLKNTELPAEKNHGDLSELFTLAEETLKEPEKGRKKESVLAKLKAPILPKSSDMTIKKSVEREM